MTAAPVGVHRPVERHRRRARHVVQRGAGGDLVEGHSGELGGLDAAHETLDRLEAGEGGGIPFSDHLSTPPHVGSRT